MSEQITVAYLRTVARRPTANYGDVSTPMGITEITGLPSAESLILAAAEALEAANKRIAELEAELDAARRWYRL